MIRRLIFVALVVILAVAVTALPVRAETSTYNVWMTARPLSTHEKGLLQVDPNDACDVTEFSDGYAAVDGEPDDETWLLDLDDVNCGASGDERAFGLDFDFPQCTDYSGITRLTFQAVLGPATTNANPTGVVFILAANNALIDGFSTLVEDGGGTFDVEIPANDDQVASAFAAGVLEVIPSFGKSGDIEDVDAMGIELEGDLSTCDINDVSPTTTAPTTIAPTTTAATTTTTVAAELPRTGSSSRSASGLGLALLVLGGAALAAGISRRKRC